MYATAGSNVQSAIETTQKQFTQLTVRSNSVEYSIDELLSKTGSLREKKLIFNENFNIIRNESNDVHHIPSASDVLSVLKSVRPIFNRERIVLSSTRKPEIPTSRVLMKTDTIPPPPSLPALHVLVSPVEQELIRTPTKFQDTTKIVNVPVAVSSKNEEPLIESQNGPVETFPENFEKNIESAKEVTSLFEPDQSKSIKKDLEKLFEARKTDTEKKAQHVVDESDTSSSRNGNLLKTSSNSEIIVNSPNREPVIEYEDLIAVKNGEKRKTPTYNPVNDFSFKQDLESLFTEKNREESDPEDKDTENFSTLNFTGSTQKVEETKAQKPSHVTEEKKNEEIPMPIPRKTTLETELPAAPKRKTVRISEEVDIAPPVPATRATPETRIPPEATKRSSIAKKVEKNDSVQQPFEVPSVDKVEKDERPSTSMIYSEHEEDNDSIAKVDKIQSFVPRIVEEKIPEQERTPFSSPENPLQNTKQKNVHAVEKLEADKSVTVEEKSPSFAETPSTAKMEQNPVSENITENLEKPIETVKTGVANKKIDEFVDPLSEILSTPGIPSAKPLSIGRKSEETTTTDPKSSRTIRKVGRVKKEVKRRIFESSDSE